jgi:RNA polymerase sigma-70 factor (ECF subfamily)
LVELYRTHVGAVRAVAASHIRDREAVADVVQETFLRVLRNLSSLQDASRFRPWLLSIARHLATDHLRGRARLTSLEGSAAQDLPDRSPSPGSLAELRELTEQVRGCVAGLSRRDATAIALVTQLGFTPEQVARALGLTPGAAKVVVHRARRRLRHALVLKVVVGQPELACLELRRLVANDPLAASRHVESCKVCIAAAASELVVRQPKRRAGTVGAGVDIDLDRDVGQLTPAQAEPPTSEPVAR